MKAAVAGGTGLVGGHLLDELAWHRTPTVAFGRRAGPPRPALEWRVTDLAALGPDDIPAGTDAAFCCLGTTLKAAGSREAFRAVDHGLVLAFARACRAAGVPQLHVVSAMGSSPASPFFYSRVKGEAERDLRALGFPTLVLYRPSLIDGERGERRPGEGAALAFGRALRPLLPGNARPVHAKAIARAMLLGARAAPPGTTVLLSKQVARAGA